MTGVTAVWVFGLGAGECRQFGSSWACNANVAWWLLLIVDVLESWMRLMIWPIRSIQKGSEVTVKW
jgi:hypothetical protein